VSQTATLAPSVTVVDYGAGNLHSVENALAHLGANVRFATTGEEIARADRLLLPGVGAFADGMAELRRRGFVDAIRGFATTDRPLMGICLGMQFLFEKSEEFGTHAGLSLIPGAVRKLPATSGIKVPHVGWNRIRPRAPQQTTFRSGMLDTLQPGAAMYFVHSYAASPDDADTIVAVAEYGGTPVTAAIAQGSIMGCQFHPEKSGPSGLAILRRFLRILRSPTALLAASVLSLFLPTFHEASVTSRDLPTLYGLPSDIRFCKRCVISNQRPSSTVEFKHNKDSKKQTIHLDEEGICDACRVAERKKDIDWAARDQELRALCDRHRKNDGTYDCIVPGSGGKDSFYAAHKLKHEYGMHPLTVTWAPHIYTEWGQKNFHAWLNAGFDNYLCTPNPRIHRLLTRLAVDNLFHPFQPFILGQKNLAPKMSLLFNIPLVFYGENEAEYGNALKDFGEAKRDYGYYALSNPDDVFFGGTSLRDLLDVYGLDRVDLEPYFPADPAKLEAKNVEVHYLGYYLKWHPQSCYYYSVEHGGFQPSPERTPGTYSKYNSIDDRIDDFHYHTTYVKFGIGRATYDAAQEIRSNDITREEGVALVRRFDGEFPERFAEEIFQYLSIPENEFPKASKAFAEPTFTRDYYFRLADKFRSPHLWHQVDGQWKLRKTVFSEV
jgi:imidazole glycerol phosphate synthase glutamine amidotransferase subunit